MREAVRVLETAGMLKSTHGVGVFVTAERARTVSLDPTLAGGFTMTDLFEVRIAIEGTAAELAAIRLTDHHRERTDSILAAAGAPDLPTDRFIELDAQFHRQIAEASGNPLLAYMWEFIAPQFAEYSHRVIGMPGRLAKAHSDHLAIAQAVRDGESSRAGHLAREHVHAVQRELRRASAIPE